MEEIVDAKRKVDVGETVDTERTVNVGKQLIRGKQRLIRQKH
jgi:hypothetical protein